MGKMVILIKNSHASWMATTTKKIIEGPIKELRLPLLVFKKTK